MGLLRGVSVTLLAIVGSIGPVAAQEAEYSVGVVTEGAFLLSEQANVQREGRWVYGLVGYLPVGTRIYYFDNPVPLNNLREGERETYMLVYSSIGIKGLLREDRFRPVKDNPIAVVVTSDEIWLHSPDRSEKPEKLLTIGRYGGNYIELTGAEDDDYYDGVLHRGQKAGDLPMSEPVSLWKEYVRSNEVIIVKPASFAEQDLPVPRWSRGRGLGKTFVQELAEKVKAKLGDNVASVQSFLEDANSIQCLLKAQADLEFGFKILSNGLSFQLDLDIKDHDQMLRMQQHELVIGGRKRTYIVFQNVRCDGLTPERLYRFTLQEGAFNLERREFVRLKDWDQKPSEHIISLAGRDVPFRMIRIKNESGYLTALRRLDGFVSGGQSFIGKLPPEEKEILLNFILREISYFDHRTKVTAPAVSQAARRLGSGRSVAQIPPP